MLTVANVLVVFEKGDICPPKSVTGVETTQDTVDSSATPSINNLHQIKKQQLTLIKNLLHCLEM